MTESDRVEIRRLDTKVSGLNEVLGGGIPEFSFNLLAGGPGAGKTTLAQQMAFALATPERPALYITVLGEPPLKLLRYQQQFSFFDPEKVNRSIRFVSVEQETLKQGLEKVLDQIVAEVETANPGLVVVDSFRSVIRVSNPPATDRELPLQSFVQRLALHLTTWQATTFLVGEYQEFEIEDNPVLTVADGIIWLSQVVERNSVARKLRVVKIRGQEPVPGLHTFKITRNGLLIFPRLAMAKDPLYTQSQESSEPTSRVSIGVVDLDDMLGGGIPAASSLLLAGPSGSGKTVLTSQFLLEGAKRGEQGLLAVFEKPPAEYVRSNPLGADIVRYSQEEMLHVIHLRPLDLSLDETLHEIRETVIKHDIKRMVIDSVSSLELAMAPGFREDFRETLHRMVAMLALMRVTVIMTVEMVDSYIDLRFSPHGTAFLTDGIIMQRYVELDGQLKRLLTVVKLRGSRHSKEMRLYEVTNQGLVVGASLPGYEGLISGSPTKMKSNQRKKAQP
ncbi:MAG TPA: ATPase domain-containing protein [Nitrospiraceae bacterium]|nr:ATPase domain-containing protein [Nitrospiraceae bacterium]